MVAIGQEMVSGKKKILQGRGKVWEFHFESGEFRSLNFRVSVTWFFDFLSGFLD